MLEFRNALGELITLLTWLAPTQNVDGSDIDYALTYRLYVDAAPVSTFPGSLNPDGRYQYPLADVAALSVPGEYALTLTAFPEGTDLETKPELESDQSNAITITAILVRVPKEPTDLSTE
ncbi:MAG: hypothetical protein JSW00_08910 [Thermoplasmata archaeon]|nr:MAG: hypothetical protein JSW00_08910 [Thermoplasmata archaeon]